MTAWGPRADVLLNTMLVIEMYTLRRALTGLTQEEFDWEPHPGAWGIRPRAEGTTPKPTRNGGNRGSRPGGGGEPAGGRSARLRTPPAPKAASGSPTAIGRSPRPRIAATRSSP